MHTAPLTTIDLKLLPFNVFTGPNGTGKHYLTSLIANWWHATLPQPPRSRDGIPPVVADPPVPPRPWLRLPDGADGTVVHPVSMTPDRITLHKGVSLHWDTPPHATHRTRLFGWSPQGWYLRDGRASLHVTHDWEHRQDMPGADTEDVRRSDGCAGLVAAAGAWKKRCLP